MESQLATPATDRPEYLRPPLLNDTARQFVDGIFGPDTTDSLGLNDEHAEPILTAIERLHPRLLDSRVNQARFLALLAGKSYARIAEITNARNANSVRATFWNLRNAVTTTDDYDQAAALSTLRGEVTDYRISMEGYEPLTADDLLTELISRDPAAVHVRDTGPKRRPHATPDRSVDPPAADISRARNDPDPDVTHYDGYDGKEYTVQKARKHAENVRRLAEKVIDRTGISKPAPGYETSNLVYPDAYIGYADISLRRDDVIRLGAAATALCSGDVRLPS